MRILSIEYGDVLAEGAPLSSVAPAPRPDTTRAVPWQPIFDGRTLDCLSGQGQGAWRVENGALVSVEGVKQAVATVREFGDGQIRICFDVAGVQYTDFKVRHGPDGGICAEFDKPPLTAMGNKPQELIFTCRGADVSATLNGQPVRLGGEARPLKGRVRFYVGNGTLRVLSLEYRELPVETGAVAAGAPLTPELFATEVVWVDDALPAGAMPTTEPDTYSWKWAAKPEPVFSGNYSHTLSALEGQEKTDGMQQHYFEAPTAPLPVGPSDVLFTYVYLDPRNPPRELMLQWRCGANWEHRAYWGADLLEWGTKDSPARLAMGPLPKTGEWVRLAVRARDVGFEATESSICGWAFSQYGGTIYWDKAGVVRIPTQEMVLVLSKAECEKALNDTLGLLHKNDVNAALARLEQARADPKLALVRPALDTATGFVRSMESANKAALDGAALLVDKRKFTFRTEEGQVVRTGEGSRNTVSGVKDGTILVEQEAGGAKVTQTWKLADLSPQTRYELACLGMPPGPESEATLAFAGIVAVLDGAEGARPKEIRDRIEAAEKAQLPREKVEFLVRRLEVCEREAEAAGAIKRADVLLKDKNKAKVRESVLWLKRNYAGTAALARWLEARGGDLEKILGRPGLRATYYECTGNMAASSLCDTTGGALGTCTVPNIELPTKEKLGEVFGRSENIAIRFSGYVNAPRDGQYIFYTNSDDGSILEVAGKLCVDNEGVHVMVEKSGVMTLTAGQHPFRLSYYQGGGGAGLTVSWSGPDILKEIMPPSAFSHDTPDIETIPQPEIPAGALLPKTLVLDLGGGTKVDLVLAPPGEFGMGSEDGEKDERPVHKVRITHPFYIGKCEVTVGQFKHFVDKTGYKTEAEKLGKCTTLKDRKWQEVPGVCWKTPGFPQDGGYPAVLLTWYDAQAFVGWASQCTGRKVRLPTEAEWEYAARGPQGFKYAWGNEWDGRRANHADATFKNSRAGDPKWGYSTDTDGFVFTAPAGRIPNASWCGAFDMAGNAFEWVQDRYSDKYYAESPPADPQGPTGGNDRVFRGGSWKDDADACRGAKRRHAGVGSLHTPCLGFRVVVAAPAGAKAAATPASGEAKR